MAQRRMFCLSIVDSDAFLDMPLSTQALYFHLSMRADDDGFVNNPKRLQRLIGAGDDDLKLLIAKRFILTFDSGIIVIKHWKMNNYIQKDRYIPTIYQEEFKQLITKENKSYTECIQPGYKLDTQVSIGKCSKESESGNSKESIESGHSATTNHIHEEKFGDERLNRSYYDWSDYSEEEMTELYPSQLSNANVRLTIAEFDLLYKLINNKKCFDDYIYKLQFYTDIKDQFTTILNWAIQDGNYQDIKSEGDSNA